MRIVLTGLFYPMAILRYFEAALRRREDIELYTAGPYTGAWIPWDGGMNLPQKYARHPNLPMGLDGRPPRVPITYVEQHLPWQPDLWLQVDAGFHLLGKPTHGKNVIVGTDPHVLDYGEARKLADTFYCMQTPYAAPADEYLPYAYDPIWHAPEKQASLYDVCLLGLHYEQRNQLVAELQARGVRVNYGLGPVFDEARALYNQAPIGLNWSSRLDLTARVFELLGMARLAVVNAVPDLDRFFVDGRDLLTFTTLEQAIEAVQHALSRPAQTEKIAKQGHKTVRPHTWDARVSQILEAV